MMCVISVYMNDRLYKEFSSKYFVINHQKKYIEFSKKGVSMCMFYRKLEIEYENGICHIIIRKDW